MSDGLLTCLSDWEVDGTEARTKIRNTSPHGVCGVSHLLLIGFGLKGKKKRLAEFHHATNLRP